MRRESHARFCERPVVQSHRPTHPHICGHSRAGYFLLKRKTRRDRMRVRLRAIKEELRRRMHEPIPEQGRWLGQMLRGYFAYHAVPTNTRSLCAFRHHVTSLWRRSLRRRSQRDRTTWDRAAQLVAAFLPALRIIHPWPHERFAVNHPRWKPGARIAPAGFTDSRCNVLNRLAGQRQ